MRSAKLAIWSGLACSLLFALTGCMEALSPQSDDGSVQGKKQAHTSGDDSDGKYHVTSDQTWDELDQAKAGTARYNDFKKGKADYQRFSLDIPGMGHHFLKDERIDESTKTMDFSRSYPVGSKEHRKNPGIILYNDDGNGAGTMQLIAVEYIAPFSQSPPTDLFSGTVDDHAWHPHPNVHELLPNAQKNFSSVRAACHYQTGAEVLLAVTDDGDKVLAKPVTGEILDGSSWTSVDPSECPPQGPFGTSLRVIHDKLWTLHAWVWKENPDGVFAPTNPDLK